jgi:enoyl-CoA hydratase
MGDYSDYQGLLVEKQDGVATVTLNRPEKLNAVDNRLHYELTKIWRQLREDRDVRAVVLTGAGRGFCAGGDFSPGRDKSVRESDLAELQEARLIIDELLDCEKPIICGLNGHAMGLGASMALACDVVYMAKTARIADPHVRMGLTAGDGGAIVWPLLIGPSRAKYWLMTGEHCTAEKAYELGLVQELVEDADGARAAATDLARKLAAGPSFAIQSSKVSVNKYVKFMSNMVFPLSLALESQSMALPDHQEAVLAFQEKREPRFR